MRKHRFIWWVAPITLVLATSGCATKKYVRQQVAPVNQKVATVEKQTNQKIAAVVEKHNADISAVNERITTTDQRVTEVAAAAQQAQGTASRAMETADGNTTKITTLTNNVAGALNFELVEKADVTFGFNKSTLGPLDKAALDQVAAKAKALPRSVVEVVGFTDRRGSSSYNLALSRRRADAVQRYLITQGVPVRSIHMAGMGEENPPAGLEADVTAMTGSTPTKAEANRMARRVLVRVYGAGDITGTASRSEQQ